MAHGRESGDECMCVNCRLDRVERLLGDIEKMLEKCLKKGLGGK